jgi:protein-S-isoprenylcysteine O-methyltransferase Ste14
MASNQIFRWLFTVVFVGMMSVSVHFRFKARRSGEAIPRACEGRFVLLARLLFAASLYLPIVAYMLNPDWMAWAALPLPAWLRWLGAAVGLSALPLLYWVFSSIGSNISETTLTKDTHRLVSHGPFHWVRHPLYSVATVVLISMGIVAANWFMVAMACLVLVGITVFVIPKEEAQLVRKFGPEYQDYMRRTGRLVPRLLR